MKILNLFAGIGGNRKLWGNDYAITALEYDNEIANLYKEFYPNDKIIVTDVIKWINDDPTQLLEYDFVWASPPCITHSMLQMYNHKKRKIPDLNSLYGLKLLFDSLQHYKKFKYVIENVQPWYKALMPFTIKLGRHLFWTNFYIKYKDFDNEYADDFKNKNKVSNVNLSDLLTTKEHDNFIFKNPMKKRQIIRNLVPASLGKYILYQAFKGQSLNKYLTK